MNNFSAPYRARRYLAFVSMFGTTQIHKRNPYTIACWSMAFPGFGHLLLNKFIRGYALVLWEIYINQKIHLNQAIIHSFNGQFQAAREVLDPRFMSLYIPVYLFAIWDSYRTTVDLNKMYVLARRENAKFNEFTIGALEVNYLDKRKPWVAVLWSMGLPSVGQLYLHRIVLATFILLSGIVIVSESHIVLAMHDLILGDLRSSKRALNAQWLLYLPSFLLFLRFLMPTLAP
ncbi:hypothetical protein [Cohnella rhizosphaerae]|uniref:Uncharacterized protein n=1 Tax=Cohnella rhizosphaerae TaxID=1457232 RepID=A0A9X4KSD0_9BACL|nr:hypothetical protein [Cohnella rhizosphaerae]MDG0809975.1 hypothetical protein [Cohnella rhizosphaerae]